MRASSNTQERQATSAIAEVRPGKDHYVRSGGKLLGILLASLYPTEWDLEQARRDYERGVGAPVELSCRRSAKGSAGTDQEEGDLP